MKDTPTAPCWKATFRSASAANRDAKRILRTRTGRASRAYRCNRCGKWHLTSRADVPKTIHVAQVRAATRNHVDLRGQPPLA